MVYEISPVVRRLDYPWSNGIRNMQCNPIADDTIEGRKPPGEKSAGPEDKQYHDHTGLTHNKQVPGTQ